MTTETLMAETIEEGEKIDGYRPICGLAIAGAVVGALSVTAYIHPALWSLPFVGALLNALALRQIAASGSALLGRRVALAGLTCSLLFGSTSVAHSLLEPVRLRGQARRIAAQWFAALREGEVQQAHQLSESHWRRLPADNLAWRYEQSPEWKTKLKRYVSRDPVRTLLALGERAQVRFVRNERLQIGVNDHRSEDVYELTVEQPGRSTSCLLKLDLRCFENLITKQWGWEVRSAEWVVAPPASWNGTE